jgi:LPXTG-site transpeptidase (sortase) family protein
LLIPSLELNVPVVEVSWALIFQDGTWRSVWQTAWDAVGHHRNSANPGEAGNVVLSGHHNTAGEVFRDVSEIGQDGARLRVGDELILVAADGERYSYLVVDWERFQESGTSKEQRQRHASYLDQTEEPTLTLVTCWPYESSSHRVVVIARLQP